WRLQCTGTRNRRELAQRGINLGMGPLVSAPRSGDQSGSRAQIADYKGFHQIAIGALRVARPDRYARRTWNKGRRAVRNIFEHHVLVLFFLRLVVLVFYKGGQR